MTHIDSDNDSVLTDNGEVRNTVVFFHENAGNLGLRMDYFTLLYHELGFNILAFAYRGYSDSTHDGDPSE